MKVEIFSRSRKPVCHAVFIRLMLDEDIKRAVFIEYKFITVIDTITADRILHQEVRLIIQGYRPEAMLLCFRKLASVKMKHITVLSVKSETVDINLCLWIDRLADWICTEAGNRYEGPVIVFCSEFCDWLAVI